MHSRILRPVTLSISTASCLVAAVVILLCGSKLGADDAAPAAQALGASILGISTEPPADGPVIEVDGGYMVPYAVTIPGTDIAFEMVPIPGGEFLLGSPESEEGREENEGPQVRVRVEPFWMAKHETTWAAYKQYMKMYDAFKAFFRIVNLPPEQQAEVDPALLELARTHAVAADKAASEVDAITSPTPLYEPSYTFEVGNDPNHPAVTMTQYSAKQYTKWLSGITGGEYRLPTEAEWEYACRAGTTTAYSFGDDLSQLEEYAWFEDNTDFNLHEVGTKKPNPWGLYDMHGNVAEWTLDEFDEEHYGSLDGEVVAAADAVKWPVELYPRVIRGGGWWDAAEVLRSAARTGSEEDDWKMSDPNLPLSPWWFTDDRAMAVGFRIIRPFKPMCDTEKKLVWEADEEYLRYDIQDRLDEGRGAAGKADAALPTAVKAVEKLGDGA